MATKQFLHTTIRGNGQPIVLIHGFLSSSHYFKPLVRRLEKTHQVISIDLLGFGKSPKPRISYTFEDHTDALHRTLQQYAISTPFTLVGHSMGALIALRYAATYPDSIAQLQLFNAPMFTDASQMIEHHKSSGTHYRTLLYSRLRSGYWGALKLVPHNATSRRPPINFADTVRMSRHAREGSYKNIIASGEFFSDLRKITVDTVVVVGKYDRVVYQENLRGRSLPSHVTIQIVESGHHTLVKTIDEGERILRKHLPA